VELGLGGSANVTGESSVRNAVSVLEDVFQVLNGPLQLEALDGSRSFVGVLEVSSEIGNFSLSGCNTKSGLDKEKCAYTWFQQRAVWNT